MNKDQLILEKIYMEMSNIIQGNFRDNNSIKKVKEFFRKYGDFKEGDEIDEVAEEAVAIGMLWDFEGFDWEYFEELDGNVIITRFDMEDDEEKVVDAGFRSLTVTPKEFLEFINNL